MLSETLTGELQRYEIGNKVRALRLGKKMGLVELGAHTGLSPAMLSKIERSQLFPTLPTLLRIALVFGVGLEHFFVEGLERSAVVVTRARERIRLPDQPGASEPSYLFESLDFPATDRRMTAYLAVFAAGAPQSAAHEHDGAEFIFVLEGRLSIEVEGSVTLLEEGDSAYFESQVPHRYGGQGDAAKAIVVTVGIQLR